MTAVEPTRERVEWRSVVGAEGHYEVSSDGQVRSVDKDILDRLGRHRRRPGRTLRQARNAKGYPVITLSMHGSQRLVPVHRLVLEAFAGARPEGAQACHTNGDRTDNTVTNLRWDSVSGNARDTVLHGTHRNAAKTTCSRGHGLGGTNIAPTSGGRGWRECRACSLARNWARHRGITDPVAVQAEADRRYEILGGAAWKQGA